MKQTIILNPDAQMADDAARFFNHLGASFLTSEKPSELGDILNEVSGQDDVHIVVCGGDGCVNAYVNAYMNLSADHRDQITSSFLPGGKANDFVYHLGKSSSIPESLENILNLDRRKSVDVIKVNDHYFVTGGGLGICVETIRKVSRMKNSTLGQKTMKTIGRQVYPLCATSSVFSGYNTPSIDGVNYMIVAVQNQPFIGRNFLLAPEAVNDDGLLNITYIPKPKSKIGELAVLAQVGLGRIQELPSVEYHSGSHATLQTDTPRSFMADGEELCHGTRFDLDVIPGALHVKY